MKLNGFEYTEDEILEALRAKGYLILKTELYFEDQTFPNDWEVFRRDVKCAVKGDELPCEKNQWENVAIREFQKNFVKPKLV